MNKLVLDNNKYNGLVADICRQIVKDNWRPDYVVGITRGGLLPAVMISQYLEVPCHTLNVSLRDSTFGPESNLWMAEDAFGYVNDSDATLKFDSGLAKKILIVDDINDSGATLNWIIDDWQSGCLPNSSQWQHVWNNNVRFAVLVDNLASNCKVKMDYVGMEVNKSEKDVWIEFPYENWWAK